MITSRGPRPLHAWRPFALSALALVAWDVGVTMVYMTGITGFGHLELQVTVFGTAIALFVGFMVNAAYGRWWEARTLWGQLVNSSRSLAREARVLIDTDGPDADPSLPGSIIRGQIAFVHTLRTSLRKQDLPDELDAYLPREVAAQVRRAANQPNAIATWIGGQVATARRRGMLGELSSLQLEQALVRLTDTQGGMERIRNTPLPVQYRFLPRFFAAIVAVVLPFVVVDELGWMTPVGSALVGLMFLLAVAVGDELADPFADGVWDVPMTALCRTIEIDLVQLLDGEPPTQLQPTGNVLW